MRVESDWPAKGGGWNHRLNESRDSVYRELASAPTRFPSSYWTDLHAEYVNDLKHIPDIRGVSPESLRAMGIGWSADRTAHSFPMRNEKREIIGIRLRKPAGAKFCVPGSQTGIFLADLTYTATEYLLIMEGPTDTAAALDLGHEAIGRPSCMGGTEIIKKFLAHYPYKPVIIIADNDSPKRRPDGSLWYPGIEGAKGLQRALSSRRAHARVIMVPGHKDLREWRIHGCMRGDIDELIALHGGYR